MRTRAQAGCPWWCWLLLCLLFTALLLGLLGWLFKDQLFGSSDEEVRVVKNETRFEKNETVVTPPVVTPVGNETNEEEF